MRAWRARVGVCAIVPVLSLMFSGLALAATEPSPACRDVAARFASAGAELDARALAGLMACVSTEMLERTGGSPPSPPSGSPGEAGPAPEPAPAPRVSERGAWPLPPPWGSEWPTAAPWDR